MSQELTLEDFEVRYRNIRRDIPGVENCSVRGCKNPRDSTEALGWDTSCAYHRLLFDYWACEAMAEDKFYYYLENQRARRTAFTKWRNKLGKVACDKIVLELAKEPINWKC